MRLLPVLLVVLSSLGSLAGCSRDAGNSKPPADAQASRASRPLEPAPTPPGAEIAEAKKLVAEMLKAPALSAISEILSNDSAAMVGFALVIPMGGACGMMGSSPAASSDKDAFEVLLRKYNFIIESGKEPSRLTPEAAQNGRAFLADMHTLVKRVGKRLKSGLTEDLIRPRNFKTLDGADYAVVSPSLVRVTPKNDLVRTIEVRVEDGKWRLHLGDFDTYIDRVLSTPGL